jgi:Fe-S-cluster-containing hydrogenase component 2
VRNCPPEFGAIFDRGLDVVIVPELCSGCPVCVMVCPVDCIYVDEDWSPTGRDMWTHIELTAEGSPFKPHVSGNGHDRHAHRTSPGRLDTAEGK